MEIVSQIAPEVDRLVLSVNAKAAPQAAERVLPQARELGLESLDYLPHLGNFLMAGRLTPEVAHLRLRYAPAEAVRARLEEMARHDLIAPVGDAYRATAAFRPVLKDLAAVHARAAADLWGDHADQVEAASATARTIGEAAEEDHIVAVLHHQLDEPEDRYLRLHQRLVTLRYVRQHDHAEAWSAQGLTVDEIKTMTDLWLDGTSERLQGLADLVGRGLASAEPPTLTAEGVALREAIEAETNRRNERAFGVLDQGEAAGFLAALKALPGTV